MVNSIPPVPFDAPAVERGYGFFETVLIAGWRAVLWEPHCRRLLATLARFELPSPGSEGLRAAAVAALDAAGVSREDRTERALRLSWIAVGADLDASSSWRLDVSVREIPVATIARRAGARVVSLPGELRRDSPANKSTSYFAAITGLRHARRLGAEEGLFREGELYLEGTSTALAVWNGGAPAGCGPLALPSVTAEAFLGGRGERRAVTAEEIRAGALLLGSLTKATPVVALDGGTCAFPRELREACEAFNARLTTDPALFTELAD